MHSTSDMRIKRKDRNVTSRIALSGGTLIDGTGAGPVNDALILIEDGKIAYAGPVIPYSDEYETINLPHATIIPGIVDAHLHFSGNLTDDDSDWVLESVEQKAVVAAEQARECLRSGLTTVGEIGRYGIAIRDMVNAGIIEGPRVVATGLGFCRTSGHGDSHRLPLALNNAAHPWAERVDGPWDLRKAIRRRLRENPDAIKIWSTGGGIWRWDKKTDLHYTLEEIQAVVDECNMVGIPVWSHCEGFEGALNSAIAGVHLIIHGQALNEVCLEIMADKGIYLCPTIQFLNEWFKTYPPVYIPDLHDLQPGDTLVEKELNRVYSNLRTACAMGIKLTIGSDSFCSQLTPYGETALGEMRAFVKRAGLSPMEALVAGTRNGAEMLGVDNVTGTIEQGKYADMIVLDGNPLNDIDVLSREHIVHVLKDGRIVR